VRKIARYVLGLLTLLSLFLWVAAAALWVQSRAQTMQLHRSGETELFVRSEGGELSVMANTNSVAMPPGTGQAEWKLVLPNFKPISQAQRLQRPISFWNRVGFGFDKSRYRPVGWKSGYWMIVSPYWFLLALATPLSARWLIRGLSSRRRRRLAASGRCTTCGYDLRGTPARCPECGSTPQPQAKA
jgi:hypothetical protein